MHRRKFPTLCAPLSPPHGNPAYESTDNKFEPVAPFNFTESPPYTPSVLSSPGYSPSSPDYTPTMPAPPSPSAPLSAPQPAPLSAPQPAPLSAPQPAPLSALQYVPLSAPQYVPLRIPATAAAAPQYVPPSADSVSGPLRTAELMLEAAGVHWQLSKDYLAWLRLQSDAVLRAQHAMVEAILCCVDGRDQCRASLEAALAKSMWMVML